MVSPSVFFLGFCQVGFSGVMVSSFGFFRDVPAQLRFGFRLVWTLQKPCPLVLGQLMALHMSSNRLLFGCLRKVYFVCHAEVRLRLNIAAGLGVWTGDEVCRKGSLSAWFFFVVRTTVWLSGAAEEDCSGSEEMLIVFFVSNVQYVVHHILSNKTR